ncbi:MAG: phosphoadenylyl-sulfate reductase [Candidatus Dadabacteria bacterium]|nr:phosphoadenylyl-sulfate reductase [Candidatus Dadabacteria bacterium]MDE0520009.1 phosphoadenylyl-sulfate reductase [Candidatus Dadabacteria bacterium]MDE0662376.1 phosphoadenylyl-sulfate reductase [Candidatus Dadabacteria bacterium]
MKFSEKDVKNLNHEFERSSPEDILAWASANLDRSVALATSFQVQGMVLVDMFAKANPEARIFTLDTGRLHSHTYDVMDKTREKYNINIEVLFPDTAEVEEMVISHGVNLFYKSVENRRLCCQVRKTNPLNGYLKNLDAWIASIRADQTEQRAESSKFEIDYLHGKMLKINPILDWTADQVWDYVRKNDVPYNKLHDMGYPSIGCAPCTRAVEEGEDPRAGRWWWEQGSDKECGIHFSREPQS